MKINSAACLFFLLRNVAGSSIRGSSALGAIKEQDSANLLEEVLTQEGSAIGIDEQVDGDDALGSGNAVQMDISEPTLKNTLEASTFGIDEQVYEDDASAHKRDLQSCYTRWYTFENGISGDWDQQTTSIRQNTIGGVWAMHSKGTGADNWARMRYAKYTFNNNPTATTRIKVTARGAPDGGKNSNAYLIETKGVYNLDAPRQDNTKDEIDFFEYYGGSNKETMNVFRRGKQVANYPQTLTKVTSAGNKLYTYELILKKAEKYLLVMVYDETGKEIERRELTGDSVPTQPMELFLGIWDCSSWCPGKVAYDTWMGVKSVYIEAC